MSDSPDWTRPITIITGSTPAMSDFPDWTEAIAVASGSVGYASLTGAGQTTTPGDLDQAGGLSVTSGNTGEGFLVTTNHTGTPPTRGIKLVDGSCQLLINRQVFGVEIDADTGIKLSCNGSSGISLQVPSGSGAVTITAGSGQMLVLIQTGVQLGNLSGDPASTPSGSGYLYTVAGALRYKGSSGTVTPLAPA